VITLPKISEVKNQNLVGQCNYYLFACFYLLLIDQLRNAFIMLCGTKRTAQYSNVPAIVLNMRMYSYKVLINYKRATCNHAIITL